MKNIPLTKGMVSVVDDDDYEYLSQWKWCFNGRYAVRTANVDGKPKTLRMHRVIMNPAGEMEVDHVNRDRLDNRRSNLRICTGMQNRCNVSRAKNNKSGYKGVSERKDKIKNRYSAYIGLSGKRKSLGSFPTALLAAVAYDAAAKIIYGEYAFLNFREQ